MELIDENMYVSEYNIETGETVVRKMTSEEVAKVKLYETELENKQSEADEVNSIRKSALARLGLTEEEINAFLS